MVTHKLQAILAFCFLLAFQAYAETTSSIEIERPPAREKRDAPDDPLLFIGKLTLRQTGGKATVIGVNATFHADAIHADENDRESNQARGDVEDHIKVWFFGQFSLGDGPYAEIVRVRVNLNGSEISRRVPYTGLELYDRKTDIGFRGTLTASNGHFNDVRVFSAHLGFRSKFTPNRRKRQAIKTTLSLNGELTVEMTVPCTETVYIVTCHVNGDVTIGPNLASDGYSPHDQFLANEPEPYQNYLEVNGNLTVKVGGRKILDVPGNVNVLAGLHRTKRGAKEDDKVVDVEYHGICETSRNKRNGIRGAVPDYPQSPSFGS